MSMVSLLGFDVTHVMLSLTKHVVKPVKLIVVIGKFGNYTDPRVYSAFNTLEQICSYMRIELVKIEVNMIDLSKAVKILRNILLENLPLTLDIGGGPRLLVFETLLAYFSLPVSKRRLIDIYVYLEGSNDIMIFKHDDVLKALHIPRSEEIKLTFNEKIILDLLREHGSLRLKDIKEYLEGKNIYMSKQNIVRILNKLIRKRLVERIERGLYSVSS